MSERVEAISAGRHGLSSEQVRASRRDRLVAAMVEAVALYGYPGTTIGRLVALARISKSDFYGIFASKEECFWAAFEDCLDRFAGALATQVGAAEEGRPQLAVAITALAEAIDSEPRAASLVLVDSLALGPAADDPRAASQERFEAMLGSGVATAGGQAMEPLRARGVVIGLRRLAYQALRDGDSSRLRRGRPSLVDWIVDCATAPPPPRRGTPMQPPPAAAPPSISWEEPPANWPSRVGLEPRERIMRACVQLIVEEGYEKLSIPRIVARAGTSNQTLYEEFGGKEAALIAAFDAAVEPMLVAGRASLEAIDGDVEARIEAVLGEISAHLTAEPLLGELCFRAMPRVGRSGLERLDIVMGRIGELLLEARRGRRSARRGLRVEAAVGGLWGMMRAAAMDDRRGLVPLRDLVDFASIALLGPRAS